MLYGKSPPYSGTPTVPVQPLGFLHDQYQIDTWYVSTHTNIKKGSEQLLGQTCVARRRREHGRGRSQQSRERQARRGTTSKQHTEWYTSSQATAVASRLRLQTWSKSDCLVAQTTSQYLHMCLYVHIWCIRILGTRYKRNRKAGVDAGAGRTRLQMLPKGGRCSSRSPSYALAITLFQADVDNLGTAVLKKQRIKASPSAADARVHSSSIRYLFSHVFFHSI